MESIIEGILSDCKLRILIIHNFYRDRGGEAQTVLREKSVFEKRGHHVILFTKDNKEIEDYTFFKNLVLIFKVFFSIKTYREIRRVIKKQRPDIAHIHNIFPLISPSIYFALKKHNIPVVQTLHNYRLICPNGLFLDNEMTICEKCIKGNFFHAIKKKCYRKSRYQTFVLSLSIKLHRWLRTFNHIDAYVSPSHFLKNKLVEAGFPGEKIQVKSHFVNTDELTPAEGFDDYSVFMGRIAKEKGIFFLSDVFKELPDLKLKIIGSGPCHQELMDLVEQNNLGNVEISGFEGTEKRFQILKRAMFLIFPSNWYENFPLTLIESLSLGIPVIASRIGGIPEVIKDGVNGFLFQSGNTAQLKEKISILVGDREKLLQMRKKAREIAEKNYSQEQGYKTLLEIYNRCMQEQRMREIG